jgi:HD superfamily phosphodiesterase
LHRLDAIGAVGIARCFTFAGHFGRVLHDPAVPPRQGLTKEQYMAGAAQATTINHFHEKLLRLKVGPLMQGHEGRARECAAQNLPLLPPPASVD